MTRRSLLPVLVAGLLLPLAACGSDDVPEPAGASPRAEAPTAPDGWRTEVWRDASVEVPADWGWGTAPVGMGGDLLLCGDAGDGAEGYVGRPIMLSDLCLGDTLEGPPPAGPSVWLGVDLEPGTEDLGGGWVRETVAQGSTTVTVTSDDPALREQVLASVGGPTDCKPELARPPHPDSVLTEGYGDPVALDVCLYRSVDGEAPLTLVYGATLARPVARGFSEALGAAPAAEPDCGRDLPSEWMTVALTGEPRDGQGLGGGTQQMAVGCGVVESSPGEYHRLDGAVLDTLRVQGLPSTMVAQIGMLG